MIISIHSYEVTLVEEEVELHHVTITAGAATAERAAADLAAAKREAELKSLELCWF